MTKLYTPRADSLASNLIGYFTNHPGAALTLDDIVDQFSCSRANIHTLLAAARDAGMLARSTNEDDEYTYSAGKTASSAPRKTVAQTMTALKARNAGTSIEDAFMKPAKRSNAPMAQLLPDPAAVLIEDGIPLPGIRGRPKLDWMPLLTRLKPGQSCKLPLKVRHTLSNAIGLLHKAGASKFTLRTFADTQELRVWRTA